MSNDSVGMPEHGTLSRTNGLEPALAAWTSIAGRAPRLLHVWAQCGQVKNDSGVGPPGKTSSGCKGQLTSQGNIMTCGY